MNIDQFEKRINESFHKNGGFEDIIFSMNYDVDQMLQINAEAYNKERDISISVERLKNQKCFCIHNYKRQPVRFYIGWHRRIK